jgi:hypothetical protein
MKAAIWIVGVVLLGFVVWMASNWFRENSRLNHATRIDPRNTVMTRYSGPANEIDLTVIRLRSSSGTLKAILMICGDPKAISVEDGYIRINNGLEVPTEPLIGKVNLLGKKSSVVKVLGNEIKLKELEKIQTRIELTGTSVWPNVQNELNR